ncbi:hypothetical protein [Streptomyces sp. NBC_00271]|uniref:hypothetical protein n=1 Tax=Streptomyces sp. NBC_00271 TaxID=2975697 RepID=UPI002E29210C|nr:hypothetical protein [Streptomyces sp. NBC_00271]
MQLQDVLNRLDRWLEVNASDDFGTLNPPATASEIDAIAEDRFSLVPEIRTWLDHHNGVSTHFRHSGPGGFIPGGHYPVDAERMLLGQRDMEQDVAWSQEDDNADFVVGRTAHVKWVPLSSTHVGTQLIVDHREGPTYGAVLEIDQDLELWGGRALQEPVRDVPGDTRIPGDRTARRHGDRQGDPSRDGPRVGRYEQRRLDVTREGPPWGTGRTGGPPRPSP